MTISVTTPLCWDYFFSRFMIVGSSHPDNCQSSIYVKISHHFCNIFNRQLKLNLCSLQTRSSYREYFVTCIMERLPRDPPYKKVPPKSVRDNTYFRIDNNTSLIRFQLYEFRYTTPTEILFFPELPKNRICTHLFFLIIFAVVLIILVKAPHRVIDKCII